MDPVIWVEVLSRHRDVAARHRFTGAEATVTITIGRGYDNDLVLDDPYVAARHVRIRRDADGRLLAEDCGSASGLFLDRETTRQACIVLDGERPIRIGHSFIRIRDSSYPVAPERTGAEQRGLAIALSVLLAVLILGIRGMGIWFAETGEPKISRYLEPLLGVVGGVLGWVTVWALLSRVLSGRAKFERNLVIALFGLLAILLYKEFAQFSAFALTWRATTAYDYVVIWSVLAAICFLHLREVSAARLKLKAAGIAGLLLLVIMVQALQQSEDFYDLGRQTTSRRLLPPSLRLSPLRDESAFFAEIEQLRLRLERDREEARDAAGR
jgi:hypothetical protein